GGHDPSDVDLRPGVPRLHPRSPGAPSGDPSSPDHPADVGDGHGDEPALPGDGSEERPGDGPDGSDGSDGADLPRPEPPSSPQFDPASWLPRIEYGCTRTQGFWKTHYEAWPVSGVTLGAHYYTASEAHALLWLDSNGDASLILAHQLIAALLNVARGATGHGAIAGAQDWHEATG